LTLISKLALEMSLTFPNSEKDVYVPGPGRAILLF